MNLCLQRHLLADVEAAFTRLYGARAARCTDRWAMLVGRYGLGPDPAPAPCAWSARDAAVIAYADSVHTPGEAPLATLRRFLEARAGDAFNTVHVLPFFPSSSDDGFSVIHYREVDPAFGRWDDIRALASRYRLMADLVLNHVSRRSGWFLDFELDVAPGRDFFITPDPAADWSAVARPRAYPLLTEVATRHGSRPVWTTFSDDQIDLDYRNPDVLFEILDILLFYLSMGARVIRLDAVAYLWKAAGTSCLHRPETHEIVRLLRRLVDVVAPDAWLITETNVPHEDNISYFGGGREAHLVYQFSLPPLVLLALTSGNASALTRWARELAPPPPGCTFLNFTSSHDGIGVRPLQGLVGPEALPRLVRHVERRGGRVSTARDRDGGESPYELNIAWFDAMGADGDPPGQAVARHLCSQFISLALRGIPAVYFNSLVAAPNDAEGVARTGRARAINRRKFARADLEAELDRSGSDAARVFGALARALAARAGCPAFHPDAVQMVYAGDPRLFVVERTATDGAVRVLALHNCSAETVSPELPPAWNGAVRDLLAEGEALSAPATAALAPYAVRWLTPA